MSYSYETEKQFVFTDEGQRMLLRVRDFAFAMLKQAGAVRGDKLLAAAGSGSSWSMMACVDRLVELNDLAEASTGGAWQCRVFVGGCNFED